ncbi:APC family permease [Bryobacter aggregatus]|uniref:APC family permease n=1 Tax=Bryobacter aggregatus TaxID=360054 RepID=UPI001EE296FB|nr:APC family permease [Bryobacter aggregatus]
MPALRRSLSLSALVFTGIVMIQPTAPMPLFGVVHETAKGHVVTTILIAMLGMMLTAFSYGRMAALYPQAGSAYTYVGKEIHPTFGFLAGWSMLMDYVLNPVICTIWCARAMTNIFAGVPEELWRIAFAGIFTWLNLRNIQATARTNQILTGLMGLVILAMLYCSARYALAQPVVSWTRPFYDPATFSLSAISAGTSLAVLTYIGFDGISTLGEEVIDAKRNILRGTVLVCLIIGILSAIEAYAAQIVWPYGEPLPDIDTAYVHIAGRAGGPWLFQIVNLTLILATVGSGAGGVLAGARLMYGMGRDGRLPTGFFSYLHPTSNIPARNVILIGSTALVGSFVLSYQSGAELLNFGAFIGFMGVNLAAFKRSGSIPAKLAALGGFLICAFLWWNLAIPSKLYGAGWLAVGILWYLYSRRKAA